MLQQHDGLAVLDRSGAYLLERVGQRHLDDLDVFTLGCMAATGCNVRLARHLPAGLLLVPAATLERTLRALRVGGVKVRRAG